MKVMVEKDLCTGCGLCIDSCPEVFEMVNDTAEAKNETVPVGLEEKVKEAAQNCPTEAIKVK